jgi:hypothetical protein
MMFLRRTLGITMLLGLFSFPESLFAQVVPHTFRHEVFVLGMGGAYTAGTWRGSGLFYNPASLAHKQFHLNVPFRLEAGGIGGITQAQKILDFFSNNENDLQNISQIGESRVADLDRQAHDLDRTGGVARFFPALRLGWRNFGLQTYATVSGVPQMNSGIFQPRLDLNGYGDIGVITGYSRQFLYRTRSVDMRWYGGVALKAFGRWGVNHGFSLSEAAQGAGFYGELLDTIDDEPDLGFGMDIGAIIPLTDDRSAHVGLVAQDVVTYGDVRPDMSLNAGIHYRPLRRLNIVVDYRDLLNTSDTQWQMHLHFGGELDLTMLRIRAGAFQGYPTVGMGINLWLLKVDFVYYSQERGERLGNYVEDSLALEIQFGLD